MDILIADHDMSSAALISFLLENAGYSVFKVHDAASVLKAFNHHHPRLLLLDVAMPKISGFEICRQIRRTSDVPIIFLSSQSQLNDRVKGLQIGGDDYMIKPIEPAELLARVAAVLRRCGVELFSPPPALTQSDLTLDPIERRVSLADGRQIELTQIEFRLLYYLMQNAGRVLNPTQILNKVWGYDYEGESNSLASYILRLRKKIEPHPDHPVYLITVRKLGYKFQPHHDAPVTVSH